MKHLDLTWCSQMTTLSFMKRRIAARPAFPSLLSAARAPLAAAVWMAAAVSGCAGSDDPATGSRPVRTMSVPCTPDQPAPYASGIPYLGVHGDAGNSDIIRCETAEHFTPVWHSLSGLGLTRPNTFADGKVLYATTTNPAADGCRLHALDAKTGDAIWCKSYAPTIGRSAVEVDSDGALYFSVGASIVSVDANGDERWRTSFDSAVGDKDAAWGLHFTPDGHVATVTSSGTVYCSDETTVASSPPSTSRGLRIHRPPQGCPSTSRRCFRRSQSEHQGGLG